MTIESLNSEFQKLLAEYKQYSEKINNKPPANWIGGFWSPSNGEIEIKTNYHYANNYFTKKIALGFSIGNSFASKHSGIRTEFVTKLKTIIQNHIEKHGGYLEKIDGTSGFILGYSPRS